MWPALVFTLALVAHAGIAWAMRGNRLARRVGMLESTRAAAVDAQGAELRRIERDLHDGAQARLVALGMSLGLAEQRFASDPDGARQLVAEARLGVGEALRELRDLARGIHPPVLSDRGLCGCAARRSPIRAGCRCRSTCELDERLDAAVEAAAHFVVAEALANAAKHSGATGIVVRVRRDGEKLGLEIQDDGRGGADPAGGGLTGLRRRMEALDGTLSIGALPAARRRSARSCHADRDRRGSRAPARRHDASARGQRLRGGRGCRGRAPALITPCGASVRMSRSSTSACRRTSATRGCALRWSSARSAPATAILVVSQYVEHTYASELLAEAGGGGVGYLLKDRVIDVADFVDAVRRVASGGTALDPEVVAQLVARAGVHPGSPTSRAREREVFAARWQRDARTPAIAAALVLTVGAVEKHIASIFQKLRPPTVGHRQSPRARRARVPPRLKGATGARARRSHASPLAQRSRKSLD